MKITTKLPCACSEQELTLFEDYILRGNQTEPNGLSAKIRQAEKLFFIHIDEKCVAVGAIRSADSISSKK
ncbi:MAG: hypothetical protein ACI8WB_005679 [Phenylobacterium sp.]|jgi:hypothetical protein